MNWPIGLKAVIFIATVFALANIMDVILHG